EPESTETEETHAYTQQDEIPPEPENAETVAEENTDLTEKEPIVPEISIVTSDENKDGDIGSSEIPETERLNGFPPEEDIVSPPEEDFVENAFVCEATVPFEEETEPTVDTEILHNIEETVQYRESTVTDEAKSDSEPEVPLEKQEESDTVIPSGDDEPDKSGTADVVEAAQPPSDDTVDKSDKTKLDSAGSTVISAKAAGWLDGIKAKIAKVKIPDKVKELSALIKPALGKLSVVKAKLGETKILSKIKSLSAPINRRIKLFFDRKNIDEKKAATISIVAALTVLAGSVVLLTANYIFQRLPTGLDTHIVSNLNEVKPAADNTAFAGLDDKVEISYTIRGKQFSSVTTDKITVGEFMRRIGDKLTPADNTSENWEYIINYSKSAVLEDDMELKMDLVTFIDTEIFETIPYEIKTIETDTVPKGTKILLRSGINGTADCIYRERYLNGELQSSEKISENVDMHPQTEVVYEGVGGKFQAPNGQWIEYLYWFDAEATAYGVDTGFGGDGKYVASGKIAQIGMIAVDPNVIPLGSKCYVIGDSYDIGVVYAEDIGGAIKGNKIDIYMGDDLEAQLQFGRRQMRVYVLDLPD
ncbi:MAG: hypothetical protein GX827_06740, partial [Clostridiales bacterium]|nr:hypothetical protein [Clostridiales bacterium]